MLVSGFRMKSFNMFWDISRKTLKEEFLPRN
jgi:hypothetical protein